MSTPSKDREPLRLKIADWVDDYAETLLGSEYSGRIDRGECLDGLLDLFFEQIESLKQSLVAEMPKKIDIEIQPNPSDDEYVEWGIRNNVLAQVDQAINKVFNGRM